MNEQKNIITPIIYPSAAEFWLHKNPALYDYSAEMHWQTCLPSEYRITAAAVCNASEILQLKNPLSLICSAPQSNHNGIYYKSRWIKTPSNQRDFFRIPVQEADIYVSIPELTLIHGAIQLNFIKLLELGYNLCAQYHIDNTKEYGIVRRKAVTTKEMIQAYILSAGSISGINKAKAVSKYILNGSCSPMESKLAIMLTLPVKLGGHGYMGASMGGEIGLANHGRELLGVDAIHGDIVWDKAHVCVEYNSKSVHNNNMAYYNDSNRSNAIKQSGWTYIGITPYNIRDFSSMENIAGIIGQSLKIHRDPKILLKYESKRKEVFNNLFCDI